MLSLKKIYFVQVAKSGSVRLLLGADRLVQNLDLNAPDRKFTVKVGKKISNLKIMQIYTKVYKFVNIWTKFGFLGGTPIRSTKSWVTYTVCRSFVHVGFVNVLFYLFCKFLWAGGRNYSCRPAQASGIIQYRKLKESVTKTY